MVLSPTNRSPLERSMGYLCTIFIQAPVTSSLSNMPFIVCKKFGGLRRRHSSSFRGAPHCFRRASCSLNDGPEEPRVLLDYAATRRQVLKISHQVVAGVGAVLIMPEFALAAEEKAKIYTNIDDARKAGEKIRDIKEAADGPVLVSSSGIKYRELERGVGTPISPGDLVSVYFTISRLNGYYLDSMGYGKEGKNDVGETLTFEYGRGLVPEAVEGGMEGMQVGGKRRILVTPERGWVRPDLLPQPTSFFAERRLSERKAKQALLIEVELVKAKPMS